MYSTHEFGDSRGDDKSAIATIDVDGVVPTPQQQVAQQVPLSSEEQAHHHAQQQQQQTHQQLIVCNSQVLLHSDDDDPMTKKRRVLPFKPKRFRPEWMMYDMFKDWLRPHPNPENAMCAACDSVIKAGKSELEKHAAGKKHLKNLSVYRKEMGLPEDEVIVIGGAHEMDESIGSGTSFLQTTANESMNEQVITTELMAPSILPDNPHLLTQDIKDAVQWASVTTRAQQQQQQVAPSDDVVAMDTSQMMVHVATVDGKSPVAMEADGQTQGQSTGGQIERYFSSRKQQKYRKAWEELPEFALWLEGVDNNFYKAKCKMCAKTILADLSVLRLHAQGKRHMQLCDDFTKAKAALQSMATGASPVTVGPGPATAPPLSAVTAKPVIMSSIRKIVLPSGATSTAARRLDADSSSDIALTDLTTDQSPTFSLEPASFHDQSGQVQVQQPPVAPRQSKPNAEAGVYVSKAFVTKPAPPWKATAIVNGHVTRLELNDYKGRYVILFFYPQDFASVCPTEILALSDRVSEFRALQTEIVACSVDSHLTHLTWCRMARSDGGLANPKIPLLADPTHSISRDYGVLMTDVGHSLRAHFIIDRRGTIRHMSVNDISVGRSVDELLRMVQALQHVDEHETGCPADWKPGQASV